MMSHDARVAKIVETLRSTKQDGWQVVRLPRIGEVRVHVMPQESCKAYGWNEVWARMGNWPEQGSVELRGSAEKVAEELCKLLQAPSRVVAKASALIESKKFDGYREPEIAAIFGLNEETTFEAMAFLAEKGVAVNKGDLGWFRVAS